jgi:integrase/recombinase XerD
MKLDRETVTTLYLDYLKGLRRVKYQSKKRPVRMLFESLKKSGKDDLRDTGKQDILNFALYLDKYRRKDKNKKGIVHLSRRTKAGLMRDIKLVFEYLYMSGYLLSNVFDKLDEFDFRGVESIRKVFTHADMERFLECIDTDSFYGLRSRVIFELMYSSGLRLMEVVKLDLSDVNLDIREAVIRCSKFKKDRIVPISDVAGKFLGKYLEKTQALRGESNALFLRSEGKRIGKKESLIILPDI